MGAWDLYKHVKTNEQAPDWLQWTAVAFLLALLTGVFWFRFAPTTPGRVPLEGALRQALARDPTMLQELQSRAGLSPFEQAGLLFEERIAVTQVQADAGSWASPGEGEGKGEVSVPARGGKRYGVSFRWRRMEIGKFVVHELRALDNAEPGR